MNYNDKYIKALEFIVIRLETQIYKKLLASIDQTSSENSFNMMRQVELLCELKLKIGYNTAHNMYEQDKRKSNLY